MDKLDQRVGQQRFFLILSHSPFDRDLPGITVYSSLVAILLASISVGSNITRFSPKS